MFDDLIRRQTLHRPRQLAIKSTEDALTWCEFDERISQYTSEFARQGVRSEDVVTILLPNGLPQILCFLALARLGAVSVPLDADFKDSEMTQLISHSGSRFLLTDAARSGFLDRCLETGLINAGCLADQNHLRFRDATGRRSGIKLFRPGSVSAGMSWPEEKPLLELMTSGTTGSPRRIQRTHGQLHWLANAYSNTVDLRASDRILAVIPLSHGHGLCSALLASLSSGATLHVQPGFHRRQTLQILAAEKITVFPAVPFIFSILAETRTADPLPLDQLRLPVTGGAPLNEDVWDKVFSRWGIKLRQSYGSTETGAVTVNTDRSPENSVRSVGTPLDGIDLRIREDELSVRSPAAATWACSSQRGANRADRSPVADSEGWVLMGDRGSIDSRGVLTLLGRNCEVINVAGRKVYPEEVEKVLESHRHVREAAVFSGLGLNGEEYVKAWVASDAPVIEAELFSHCRGLLADYKIPRVIEFRTEIPRNRRGKIDRRQLPSFDRKAA